MTIAVSRMTRLLKVEEQLDLEMSRERLTTNCPVMIRVGILLTQHGSKSMALTFSTLVHRHPSIELLQLLPEVAGAKEEDTSKDKFIHFYTQ